MLRGAWRAHPPPVTCAESDLQEIQADLAVENLGGLAWWRIRRSALAKTPTGAALRQEYVNQSIRAAAATHRVYQYVSALHAHKIDPIVFKGWSLFSHYAEPGLRPAGDVDVAIAPQDAPRALEILRALGARPTDIDVHPGLNDPAHAAYIPDSAWEQVYARTQVKQIGALRVRVLAPEEELQVVSIHCARHFFARPIWLCDVAALVETYPADFDWARCLSHPPYRSWVTTALWLAQRLLDADLTQTPLAAAPARLPAWIVEDVLRRWGNLRARSLPMLQESVLHVWRKPALWQNALRARVPNRLEAALGYYAALDEPFLARYQVRAFWDRFRKFTRRNLSSDHF